MPYPIVIDTLAKFHENGMVLTAHCESCRHYAEVPMPALIERLGPEHPMGSNDLQRHFKCSKCGSKTISFIVSHEQGRQHTGTSPHGAGAT